MNQYDFGQEFDRLVQAFNVTKPEDKAKVYFEELKNINLNSFKSVVTHIIRNNDRFPSISTILNQEASINPPKRREKAACDQCDGYGWKKLGYQVYRGDCAHGQKLSKSIKVCPSEDKRYIELFNQKNDLISVYGEDAAKRMFGKNT